MHWGEYVGHVIRGECHEVADGEEGEDQAEDQDGEQHNRLLGRVCDDDVHSMRYSHEVYKDIGEYFPVCTMWNTIDSKNLDISYHV